MLEQFIKRLNKIQKRINTKKFNKNKEYREDTFEAFWFLKQEASSNYFNMQDSSSEKLLEFHKKYTQIELQLEEKNHFLFHFTRFKHHQKQAIEFLKHYNGMDRENPKDLSVILKDYGYGKKLLDKVIINPDNFMQTGKSITNLCDELFIRTENDFDEIYPGVRDQLLSYLDEIAVKTVLFQLFPIHYDRIYKFEETKEKKDIKYKNQLHDYQSEVQSEISKITEKLGENEYFSHLLKNYFEKLASGNFNQRTLVSSSSAFQELSIRYHANPTSEFIHLEQEKLNYWLFHGVAKIPDSDYEIIFRVDDYLKDRNYENSAYYSPIRDLLSKVTNPQFFEQWQTESSSKFIDNEGFSTPNALFYCFYKNANPNFIKMNTHIYKAKSILKAIQNSENLNLLKLQKEKEQLFFHLNEAIELFKKYSEGDRSVVQLANGRYTKDDEEKRRQMGRKLKTSVLSDKINQISEDEIKEIKKQRIDYNKKSFATNLYDINFILEIQNILKSLLDASKKIPGSTKELEKSIKDTEKKFSKTKINSDYDTIERIASWADESCSCSRMGEADNRISILEGMREMFFDGPESVDDHVQSVLDERRQSAAFFNNTDENSENEEIESNEEDSNDSSSQPEQSYQTEDTEDKNDTEDTGQQTDENIDSEITPEIDFPHRSIEDLGNIEEVPLYPESEYIKDPTDIYEDLSHEEVLEVEDPKEALERLEQERRKKVEEESNPNELEVMPPQIDDEENSSKVISKTDNQSSQKTALEQAAAWFGNEKNQQSIAAGATVGGFIALGMKVGKNVMQHYSSKHSLQQTASRSALKSSMLNQNQSFSSKKNVKYQKGSFGSAQKSQGAKTYRQPTRGRMGSNGKTMNKFTTGNKVKGPNSYKTANIKNNILDYKGNKKASKISTKALKKSGSSSFSRTGYSLHGGASSGYVPTSASGQPLTKN